MGVPPGSRCSTPRAVTTTLGGRLLAEWERGLAAFRAGKLPDARVHFGAFAQANPSDVAVRRYLERLGELPGEAPEGFSAVSAFKTK